MIKLDKYKNLTYKIIGAAMQVHRELGYGLLEAIYQEALSLELSDNNIKSETEKEVTIFYRNQQLKKKYRIDLLVEDNIICELKSAESISGTHRAQLCNYLRLTHKPLGLLINFGTKSLQGERWAYNQETNECILVDVNMNRLDLLYEDNDE